MSQQWYSIVEYARAFSISDMTVRRRIKTGKLHAVLKEGKYYIPVDAANKVKAHVPPPSVEVSADVERHNYTSRQAVPSRPPVVRETYRAPQPNHLQSYEERERPISREMHETPRYPKPERPLPKVENIPYGIIKSFNSSDDVLTRADHLLKFCDQMLREMESSKAQVKNVYEAKIHTLEAKVAAKDLEVQQYKQQVEDLQVLVKILERKNASAQV